MHKFSFPKGAWKARMPLNLVHVEIYQPTQIPSLGSKTYFLLFVDDYSRIIWIYFLEQKSQAFFMFIEFV